jgi:DNA-directed RNA polymerase specialized sigma24 family protein
VSDSEIVQLEKEIAERVVRLSELKRPAVTREELAGMSPAEIAKLDPSVINRALEAGQS